MAELEILLPTEQLRFNNPFNLSPDERVKYFLLPPELATWIESVTNLTNKVGFILLWGYCQAGVRFYKLGQFCSSDIKAVCQQHNIGSASVQIAYYNQRTYKYHKHIIRQHTDLKALIMKPEFFLESIQDRVAHHYSPKQILQEVFELLKVKKIEMPGYNRFALIITQAISDYNKYLL